MAKLPQLKHAEAYRACEWDLKVDAEGRRYWVELFCEHIQTLMTAIVQEYPEAPPEQLAAFRADYLTTIRAVDAQPGGFDRIDVLKLDELRSGVQERHGFFDPYRGVKKRENELAQVILPHVLRELDSSPPAATAEQLARGLMAGNVFDLGAPAAVERYRAAGSDFLRLRAGQPSRPWFMDDLATWQRRWADGVPYRHVACFVDNAGSDVCLGCLPLVRWMLREGSRVSLVANSRPALNDVTAPELGALLTAIAGSDDSLDDALSRGRLAVVASGGWAPLIDLTRLADDCVRAIADADLIILHGMGRAIESNFRASFACDCLRVALLKDREVARRVGGRLFDCIFRFDTPSAG